MRPAASRMPMTSRKFHRSLGLIVGFFFLYASSTGFILELKLLFGADQAMDSMVSTASLDRPLSLDGQTLERAREVVHAHFGNRSIASIEWVIKAHKPNFVFHLDGRDPLKVTVTAGDDTIISTAPDRKGWLLQLHTGEIAGAGGKILGMLWATGLFVMTLTGFWLYFKMSRARGRTSTKVE